MFIEWIKLTGFRNFKDAQINLRKKSLVIGSNDVGKTNLVYAIRLLLDKTLSEVNIEPSESDFHISPDGTQVETFKIIIKLSDIREDAVLSKMKGLASDDGQSFLQYLALRKDLTYHISAGHSIEEIEDIDGRYYLKHIHLRYIQSSRDLEHFIRTEKQHLLRLSKDLRTEKQVQDDFANENIIQSDLSKINRSISSLSYVATSTNSLNEELKKLSHHHSDYTVCLEAESIDFATYIDQLCLNGKTGEKKVGLGGDGRNNQILMALWKAKSEREHDVQNEAIIYCVEEPEAHLHPHQQRKLADYLTNELNGQVIVTTHSPQIAAGYSPDCIVRLFEKGGQSVAASDGCSDCIDKAWSKMGYRISILPAEAFFADAVFLVEGPSEILFYHELAKQSIIDLDYYNISILSVDGIDFKVYIAILDAMGIPWVIRTDNDITKVPRSNPPKWRLSGLNRARSIGKRPQYKNLDIKKTAPECTKEWTDTSSIVNKMGIFISKADLENDIAAVCGESIMAYAEADTIEKAVEFMQNRKAIRMGEFLAEYASEITKCIKCELSAPLSAVVELVQERRLPSPKGK
jgi:putative ATP-dependent endonuclease of the OLD family